MGVLNSIRARWRRFKGQLDDAVDDHLLEAFQAQLDFDKALRDVKAARGHFDKRPSSRPPAGEVTSISGLNAKLDLDDQQMKEAINDLDPEDH